MSPGIYCALLMALGSTGGEVDFDRDVRPILADSCFACHGPDASSRKADLRLDQRESAIADRGGYAVVVPRDVEASELWRRVTGETGELMPPPDSHRPALDARELEVLRAWIEEGAPWARHWAFVPPVAEEIDDGSVHPIDVLVERRLEKEGLELAPRAATHVLARRLAFDLTGLPPAPDRLAALGDDPSDAAWEDYIDELFASPHHGERMAMWWLDGARYADTDGFQADAVRSNWPWRDWVVQAFQSGMPFDRFTLEQFAGDLLPGATPEQVLATCFHRNHMHNGEGGRDPEESRVDYVRDRANTTGTVFLGLTFECAQCHDHKFDPISQRDYYSLSAFFDSIDESGSAGGGARPFLEYTSPFAAPAVELAERELAIAEDQRQTHRDSAEEAFESWLQEQSSRVDGGFAPWRPLVVRQWATTEGSDLLIEDDGSVRCLSANAPQEDYRLTFESPELERITGLQLETLKDVSEKLSFRDDGEFILTNLKLQVVRPADSGVRDVELGSAVASHVGEGVDKQYGAAHGVLDDDPRTGWTTRTKDVDGVARLVVALAEPLVLAPEEELVCILMHRSAYERSHLRRVRLSVTDQAGAAVRSLDPMPLEGLAVHVAARLAEPSDADLSTELRERLLDQFLEDDPDWHEVRGRHDRLVSQKKVAKRSIEPQRVTVLAERAEPRTTYVLERGVWNARGAEVARRLPESLFDKAPTEATTRLDLAHWIVARDNPLTARVIVNQLWQLCFGSGIVRTPDDFGLQGARPRYRELLDWLAVEFMDSGWDVRHVLRRIVTSRTYRQSSLAQPELIERDPSNELLARGARFRLPSWMIRDAALDASGLLNRAIGGPPVYPHQPPGVWADVFMGRIQYQPTLGQARHRRTIYAFWRRNAAPTYLFDSAMRRTCEVGARRTNTPLQALTLLNDQTYQEAALALADRALREASEPRDAIAWMGRRVLSRQLGEDELAIFEDVYRDVRASYAEDPAAASLGARPSELAVVREPFEHEALELASLRVLANLIFNLDEAITHE